MYFLARAGSRQLQALKPEARMNIINKLADLLIERKKDILNANKKDLQQGFNNGKFSFLPVNFKYLIQLSLCIKLLWKIISCVK